MTTKITETFYPPSRAVWRAWLEAFHNKKTEIWLVFYRKTSIHSSVAYADAVEEALCFGWIDGIVRKIDDDRRAQRFTPRRPKSNWSELNKERARKMIAEGLMTPAGAERLPDLTVKEAHTLLADDVKTALQAIPEAWQHFNTFDEQYRRLRLSWIEDARVYRPEVFERRLNYFLKMTSKGKRYGSVVERS